MTAARTTVITYNGWATDGTGVRLHGVHTLQEDAESLAVVFQVVLQHASSEATLDTYVAAMEAALVAENKRLTIANNATTEYDITGDLDALPISGVTAAQFVRADWRRISTHRTGLSRAYEITIVATKPANQAGKTGKRSQSFRVRTTVGGWRAVTVAIEFTPGASDGKTAAELYADATHGFAKRVSDYLGSVDVTLDADDDWELVGEVDYQEDEDGRGAVAQATYRELLFPDSDGGDGQNDARLAEVSYSARVTRRPGRRSPLAPTVRPYADLVVSFSCVVKHATPGLSTNLAAAIDDVILPYVQSTVATRLTLSGGIVLQGHSLQAEPTGNRVSGQVLFAVREGTLLEAAVRYTEQRRFGFRLVPVLNGDEFARDKHVGPGQHTVQVAIGVREEGSTAPSLEPLAASVIQTWTSAGFEHLGYDYDYEPVEEVLTSPEEEGTITTTVALRVLFFERAKIVGGPGASTALPGGTRVR